MRTLTNNVLMDVIYVERNYLQGKVACMSTAINTVRYSSQ